MGSSTQFARETLTRAFVWLCCLAVAAGASAQDRAVGPPTSQPAAPPPSTAPASTQVAINSLKDRHALVIGIDHYSDSHIPPLRYAESDARSVYETLKDGQVGRFDPANVTLLLGEQATASNVRRHLGRLRNVRKDDLVLVFFSGHGAKESGEAFWITADAELGNLAGTSLSNSDLATALKRIPSERVVTLLDCCYAAATVKDSKAGILDMASTLREYLGKGRVTIAGAGSGEEAIEAHDLKQGVFTHFLVRGLRGEADSSRDGVITLAELWRYLESQVAEQAGVRKGIQKPAFSAQETVQTDKFLLTFNAEVQRADESRLRVLRNMLEANEIMGSEFDEARRLLTNPILEESEKKRRDVYRDLADGVTPPDYARSKLDTIKTKPRQPPTPLPEPTQPPSGTNPPNAQSYRYVTSETLPTLRLVLIEAPLGGVFRMGFNEGNDDEKLEHGAAIDRSFYMAETEITLNQYRAIMGDKNHFQPFGMRDNGNFPVANVSWHEANEYCLKLGNLDQVRYRLPSEQEWEYACRAGSAGLFSTGNDEKELRRQAVWAQKTAEIIGKCSGRQANRFGLFDMHGNVAELCASTYAPYPGYPGSRRLFEGENRIVVRGGSYADTEPSALRSSLRGVLTKDARSPYVGFRIVREP